MARTKGDDRLRSLRAAAGECRRQGYEVLEHPKGDALPSFLCGFAPDLVLAKGDDHAAVVIKTREEMIGSNELVTLAKAVNAQGRFHFIISARYTMARNVVR